MLSNNARMLQTQQQELVKQGEVMARVVEATGEVIKLETSLNRNLKSLAGAKNFEDTVMSLAAAIHLLNTRLGATDRDDTPRSNWSRQLVARSCRMKRYRNQKTTVGVSLFPFLAVLICTMGALIVLLVLVVQLARVDASEDAHKADLLAAARYTASGERRLPVAS